MDKNISEEILESFDLIMNTISEFVKNDSTELNIEIASDLIFILYKIISFSVKNESSVFEIIQRVSQAQRNKNLRSKQEQCIYWIYEFLENHTMSSIFSNIFSDESLLTAYNSDALIVNEEICTKIIENMEEKCEENDLKFPHMVHTVNNALQKIKELKNKNVWYSQNRSVSDSRKDSIISEIEAPVGEENICDLSTIEIKSDEKSNDRKNKSYSVPFDTSTHISQSGIKYNSSNAIYDYASSGYTPQQSIEKNEGYLYTTFIDEYEKLIERFYSNLGIIKEENQNSNTAINYNEEEKIINKINEFKKDIYDPNTTYAHRVQLIEEITNMRLKLFLKKNEISSKVTPGIKNEHELVIYENYEYKSHYLITEKCYVCNKDFARPFRKILKCSKCHIYLHEKCKNNITEKCIEIDNTLIIMNLEICPEIGLSRQKFRCGYCQTYIPKIGLDNCRKCEYSGLYYCLRCHFGYMHVIPARMIKNFDFALYPVALISFCAIQNLWTSRIFHLFSINPELKRIFPIFKQIKELRMELSELKIFVEKCLKMNKLKILKPLNNRLHLLENDDTFTLCDLFDLHTEKLLKEMRTTKILILKHISQCNMCYDMCHMCLICRNNDPLFKFARNTDTCTKCNTIYHRKCLKNEECVICLNRYIRSS